MADVLVASIAKNKRADLQVSLCQFKGVDLCDVREYFVVDDGELRPSKKGVSIRLELLPELITALRRAETEACARGLLRRKAAA